MTSTRRTGLLLALVTACISGLAVLLNGNGVRAFGDATLYTTAKNIVAAVVLLAAVAIGSTAGARLTRPSTPGQWVGLGVIGIIGGSVPFVLFFEGLARATSTQAAFLHKTLVVWVAIMAVTILRERLGVWHWVAIALLVTGQALLAGGVTTAWSTGELMILAATLLWSVEVVIAKRLLREVSSWTVGVARMGLGSLVLIAWVLVKGDGGALVSLTGPHWGWVLLTGLILAAYVAIWHAALARAQAVDVTAVLVLAPLITAGLGAVANGTSLVADAAPFGLMLTGVLLVARMAWRPVPDRAPDLAREVSR